MNYGALCHWAVVPLVLLGLWAVVSCGEEEPIGPTDRGLTATGRPPSPDPTVSATAPTSAPRDTTLDVRVLGSNFDRGSRAELALNCEVECNLSEKVKTNSTSYVSASELVANITIALDAAVELYDVLVTTSKGKRGIGIELFAVKESSSRGISKQYEMVVLGKLPSTTATCYATLINEPGDVSGWCGTRGFYWNSVTGMIDLGQIEQADRYLGLSDVGPNGPIVVGRTGLYGATIWDPAPTSGPAPLPGLSSGGCLGGSAGGVSSAGDLIAGWACAIVSGEVSTLPVIWRRSGSEWAPPEMLPLAPGRTSGAAYHMSANGVIVGYLRPYTTPTIFDLFVWFPPYTSAPEPIPFVQFSNIWVYGINDSGDATGYGEGHHVAFWERNTSGWDLLEIDNTGSGQDINNNGEIVGNWEGGPRVWSSGVSTYLDPRTAAYAINEAGVIAGRDTKGRVVKWDPVQ